SLEAHQHIEGLAEAGRALCGQPRQAQVRWLAVLAHQQADVRPAAELDGRMAEAHEARNADARERTGEHFRRNAIAPQQGVRVMTLMPERRLQAVEVADRKVAELHAVTPCGAAECNSGL